MYSRIEQGRCLEIVNFDPTGLYHSDLKWVAVPLKYHSFVDGGYVLKGGNVQPPNAVYLVNQLKKRIASHRYICQEAGIEVAGMPVFTSKYYRDMLRDTVSEMEAGNIETVQWKSPTGWVEMSLQALKPVNTAVVQHVQACFVREAALSNELDSLAVADDEGVYDQILAVDLLSGWPPVLEGVLLPETR